MKKGLFLLIGVLTLSLSLTGCVPETTEEEDANTSEIVQTDALDTNTTEDSSSLEEDNETSLIADESDSSTTYDLVAYMLPEQSTGYIYDEYWYADGNLTNTALGSDVDLYIEISGNNYNIFGDTNNTYDGTYLSVENKTKRYVSMGETLTSIFRETCVIVAHHISYTIPIVEGYTYVDVIEQDCGEYNMYYARGIGRVAEIEEHCFGDDGYTHDDWNTSQCTSTTGFYNLLQVD